MKKTALVLLAAGSSTRYQGVKLLDKIDGKQMFQYMLELSAGTDAAPKIIVTQYREIQAKALEFGFETVINEEVERGISHSLQLGLQRAMELEPELEGVIFGVCDQPYLKKATLERLMAAFQNSHKNIAGVSYRGILGNPCIIGKKYFKDLFDLTGDVGGKRVIIKHPEDVEEVPAEEERELTDIDIRTGDKL